MITELAVKRFLPLLIILLSSAGCVSTGDPDQPYRAWTLHEWAFSHEKYTPEEKVEARCRYQNRHPLGGKTGFQRQCRLKAVEEFGMGINSAMFATGCVIDKCRELAYSIDYRAAALSRADDELKIIKRSLCRAERVLFSDEVAPFRLVVVQAVASRPTGDLNHEMLTAYMRAVDQTGRVAGIYWARLADQMQMVSEVGLERCVASWDGPGEDIN